MSYSIHRDATIPADAQLFTCYLGWPETPRGQYDEEIDVLFTGRGRANIAEIRRTAEAELAANYAPGARVKRVRRSW